MKIGIDGSRAYLPQRTGIEEYSYQVIRHLMDKLGGHEVVLYLRKGQKVDLSLPENWKIKIINFPYLWTQAGLSLEMLFRPVDVLFIPAHTVPLIHPKNTVVTIHGLEYEFVPEAYSKWEKMYMRWSIKFSCRVARKIIAVSKNTKQDLKKLYKVPEEKIFVIYEGYEKNLSFRAERSAVEESNSGLDPSTSSAAGYAQDDNKKYLLFIGRLEERKNITGIIGAFEILKAKNKIPHQLVLAGKFGYGAEKIRSAIKNSDFVNDIILTGYIDESEKQALLKNADVFLFPTFYEGFGLPVLEAQAAGVPVVCSNTSSLPEVCGGSCVLTDPHSPEFIAEQTFSLISSQEFRDAIMKKGYENVKRFSWEKCASEIAEVLKK